MVTVTVKCQTCMQDFEGDLYDSICGPCYRKYKTKRKRVAVRRENTKKMFDEYARKNNISVKCISDQILLYYRYILDNLQFRDIEDKEKLLNTCNTFYRDRIRGKMEYTNRLPKGIAAAIVWICAVLEDNQYVTQRLISEALGVTQTTILHNYHYIKELEEL